MFIGVWCTKSSIKKSPPSLRQLLHTGTRSDQISRKCIFVLPKARIDLCNMIFSYSCLSCWNALPGMFYWHIQNEVLQHFHTDCDMRESGRHILFFSWPVSVCYLCEQALACACEGFFSCVFLDLISFSFLVGYISCLECAQFIDDPMSI